MYCYLLPPQTPVLLPLRLTARPPLRYREIVRLVSEGKLSFKHVVTFNMDEYVGLPREHPES